MKDFMKLNTSRKGYVFAGAWLTTVLALGTTIAVFAEQPPKLYWGNYRSDNYGGIRRMNLDGSDTELVVEGASPWNPAQAGKTSTIMCMAIDAPRGYIYFGEVWPVDAMRRVTIENTGMVDIFNNRGLNVALDLTHQKLYGRYSDGGYKIRRSNMDGTGVELLFDDMATSGGIALDLANNYMYFAEGYSMTGSINRCNLDGSGLVTLVSDVDGPRGVALDLVEDKIYWATYNDGLGEAAWQRATVQRSDLDGSNVEVLLKGQNSAIAAPMTAYFSSPGDIVLYQEEQVFFVGGSRIIKGAMDCSGCEEITPDAGAATVASVYGLALFQLPPKGTIITAR